MSWSARTLRNFDTSWYPSGLIDIVTDKDLTDRLAAYGLPSEATLATYRAARPNASAGDLLEAIRTDWFYRIPAIRLAEAHAKSLSATYMYEFAWHSHSLQYSGRLGACHALEIAFVFDNLDNEEFEPLLGTNPPQLVADAMHAAWVAFATRGDPGWPKYDLSRRATQRFDTPRPWTILDLRSGHCGMATSAVVL